MFHTCKSKCAHKQGGGGDCIFQNFSVMVLFSIFRAESSVHIIPWSHAIATMAEHSNVTEDRIQSLVRGIVGEFFNSPENGNDQGAQGQEFTSIQSEINQRFRLPRGRTAVGISDHDTNTPSKSGNRTNGLIQSSVAIQPINPGSQPRPEPFNAITNYAVLQQQGTPGPGPTRQRGRCRVRNSCLYPRRRQGSSASSRSNNKPTSDRNELFLKDVCLLPSPSYNKVPRREAKLELQKRSLYIDAFTFDKRWDEKVLREKMWQLFSTQSTEIDLEDNTR